MGHSRPRHEIGRIVILRPREDWRSMIKRYEKDHPSAWTYDKKRGFAAPLLSCTSVEARCLTHEPGATETKVEAMVRVINTGNGVSQNAHVEIYQTSPTVSLHLDPHHPDTIIDAQPIASQVVTINPGQTVDVQFSWSASLIAGGGPLPPRGVLWAIVGACFDPLLDRWSHVVDPPDRHVQVTFLFEM